MNNIHHNKEKGMNKLFHIKIQVKKTKVDALFDFGSQANFIAKGLVIVLDLESMTILAHTRWYG
jgi:hypothetical protein